MYHVPAAGLLTEQLSVVVAPSDLQSAVKAAVVTGTTGASDFRTKMSMS
jgi:hypothetical protein